MISEKDQVNFTLKMERSTKAFSVVGCLKVKEYIPELMELNLKEIGTVGFLLNKWTFNLMDNGKFVI